MGLAALRIVDVGWGSTIQDRGRRGLAHLGVPTSGAVDRVAYDLANRLVGNQPNAAVLETAGGLIVEAIEPLVVATAPNGARHTLQAGEQLAVDPAADGVWGYLAVRGGLDVDPVLGSCSHDTLSGLGPPSLTAGEALGVGQDPGTELVTDLAPMRPRAPVIRIWPGPRMAWFSAGLAALTGVDWTVGVDISRVGTRLIAGMFDRQPGAPQRMASEGLIEGAIQITPSGEPIVMLADHPTTGGYPVIAVVDPDDIGIIAQSPSGSILRFRSTMDRLAV
jgi:biotin-dependent carboxylase-like uncharacterized protein